MMMKQSNGWMEVCERWRMLRWPYAIVSEPPQRPLPRRNVSAVCPSADEIEKTLSYVRALMPSHVFPVVQVGRFLNMRKKKMRVKRPKAVVERFQLLRKKSPSLHPSTREDNAVEKISPLFPLLVMLAYGRKATRIRGWARRVCGGSSSTCNGRSKGFLRLRNKRGRDRMDWQQKPQRQKNYCKKIVYFSFLIWLHTGNYMLNTKIDDNDKAAMTGTTSTIGANEYEE